MAGKAAKGVSELAVEGLVPKILRYAVSQGCQVTLRYEEWTTRSVGRNKAPAVLAETTTTDLPIAIETFNKGERARANCQRARGNGLENGTSSRSWTSVSIVSADPKPIGSAADSTDLRDSLRRHRSGDESRTIPRERQGHYLW